MMNFEQIRSHVQGKYKITAREPYLVCVELSLAKGKRHQSIFLAELEGEDGRKFLRVNTAIAPMTGLDAKRMLAFNWQSRVGYMAVGELDGVLNDLPSWLSFLHPDGDKDAIDKWIVVTCALVMAAGTAMGGWRIIKTLGHKMVKLHPINGFAAETSSATILSIAAHFGMPVSTTHSISTAIMGVGFAKNPKALKWSVIERIVWAWILTIPAAGGIAWGLVQLLRNYELM